jgi:ribosomal protein S18 acetylase RimI-like enzyme
MRAAITLRLGQATEALPIAILSRDLAEVGLPWIFTPERVRASLRDRASNVLVACDADRLVGAGIMRYRAGDAHLELLVVRPEARGHGLGRRMLEWLERPALLGGASAIWLEVRASNTSAQAFYRRLGYRQVAELPRYYDGREAAVRMGREVDPR